MRNLVKTKANFITWSLAVAAFSLLVVPQNYIPIWGDDFFLMRAANSFQGYGSELSLAPFQTGMTKYRPIFLVPFTAMHNFFGDQLDIYLIFNTALTLVLGICFGLLLRETTNFRDTAIPIGIISISSLRFLWFSREWIYGSMEIISLCASLLALVYYLRFSKEAEGADRNFLLANLFLIGAIFSHERGIAVGISASIFFAYLNRKGLTTFKASKVLVPINIVVASFLFKIFILQVNPIQGSLTNYADLDSKNTLLNLLNTIPGGLIKIIGFSTYKSSSPFFELLQIALSLTIILATVVFLKRTFFARSSNAGIYILKVDSKPNSQGSSNLLVLLVCLLSFGTIILEPVVQERFLVLPQLLFWILAMNAASRFFLNPKANHPAIITLITLISIELCYLPAKSSYYPTQSRMTSVFKGLDAQLNGRDPWILKLKVDKELQAELAWALGYPSPGFAGIFSISNNPPLILPVGENKVEADCIQAEFRADMNTAVITPC
jgi:hypothetical protein